MTAPTTHYSPRGSLLRDESMSRHTSWRVGGPADLLFVPADLEDLSGFLHQLDPAVAITWIGLGSNLLVRDGGIRGAVIMTHKGLGKIRRLPNDRLHVEAGVPGAKIARTSAREGLTGAEFFAGIPGTFGGALAMNAGAFGGETWNVVTAVEMIDRGGAVHRYTRDAFITGYRQVSAPPGQWFVAGELQLAPGDRETALNRIKELLSRRARTQPIQVPNAGSVFRNPPGDYAARLIEACGGKGRCVGSACVSERHANFIVNTGGARASDIETLIRELQDEVAAATGVRLEPEVRIVGEAG